ncbi:MAG: alpha-ketoglutarate-dependent dioxygenase AlkB family protein, partial [Alphaproteobacteria bacterium]
ERLRVLGKSVAVPRLTAWVGDEGYRYSGVDHEARPWPASLRGLKRVAETCANQSFNGVLLNLYRDGTDSVSWHADNEASLGRQPVIASISLGGTRRFVLKHRQDGTRVVLALAHGSCLVMAGATQDRWVHSVPKTSRLVAPRVNLTFRKMVGPA